MTSPTLPASTETRLHLLGDHLRPPFVQGGQEIGLGSRNLERADRACVALVKAGERESVKEGGGGGGERERACTGAATMPHPSTLRLILNAAALAAASPTLLFSDW
jgi:hypothetical protein